MPSATDRPADHRPYVFVSYASADRARVLPLVDALARAGVPVWIDREGTHGGESYAPLIASAISRAAAFILMASALSLDSRNVKQEIAVAWEYERPYLPLLLEPVAIPDDVRYWLTAAQWVEVLGRPEGDWTPRVLAALRPLGIAPDLQGHEEIRLAGRERELALLRERLAAARAGKGGLVLIGGEAGIGKTTLAGALCEEAAARGVKVLVGRCFDRTEIPPYGPWADLLARYRPSGEMPPPPAGFAGRGPPGAAESQAELFRQALDFFAALAAQRPVILLLDDLQWADDASIDLLRFAAHSLSDLAVLVIATYRSDELTRHQPLYRAVPLLARESHAALVELHRLGADDLAALTRDRYALPPADAERLVAYLMARADGNPFYAGELLRTLEESRTLRRAAPGDDEGAAWTLGDLTGARIPSLLRQVIEARVDRLGGEARLLLSAAAVIGPEAPLDLWAAVAEEDEDALLPLIEWALEARLLVETDDGVRFAHALIREALYEALLGPRRRALHRRTAEMLIARAADAPDADAVAYHLRQAADPRAAAWLVRAGEAAHARHAPQAAIDRFTRALDDPGGLAPVALLRVRRARGRAYETVGEFAAARTDYEQSLDLARAVEDRRAEWQALLDLGMVWAPRDYTSTERYYQQALALAREADDPALIARSLNRLGNWHVNMDQPRVSEEYHTEALAIFRAHDDRPGIAETLDFLTMTMMMAGDLRRAERYGREVIDRYRALDNRHGLSSVLATLAERAGTLFPGMFTPTATPAEGRGDAEAALQIARDIGWRAGEVYAMNQVAMNWTQCGEFGRALELLGEEVRIATAIGHRMWLVATHWLRAQLYSALLAPDVARRHGEEIVLIAGELGSTYAQRGGAIAVAQALLHEKDYAEADRLLETVTGAGIRARLVRTDNGVGVPRGGRPRARRGGRGAGHHRPAPWRASECRAGAPAGLAGDRARRGAGRPRARGRGRGGPARRDPGCGAAGDAPASLARARRARRALRDAGARRRRGARIRRRPRGDRGARGHRPG